MASVSPSGSGVLRFLAVAASLALAGCETISMQSSGSSADSSAPLPATSGFRYALVSPASSRETRDAAEFELIRHGYTVIPAYAAGAALRTAPPLLMIECYDLGVTRIVLGTTRKVRCIGVNLRSGERLYDGRGEAIGMTVVDDFLGAVKGALARLPVAAEPRGRLLTLAEVPAALADAARPSGASSGGAGANPGASSPPGAALMSSGSGFIVTGAGHVVTNAHVVDNCKTITGRVGSVDHPLKVQVVDETNDLALLTLPAGSYAAARLRQPGTPRLGERVTVIGFPLQDQLASSTNVTTGNISALAGLRNDISHFQLTAPIQPGNSGGPVVDEQGALIGVVVSKISDRAMAREGLVAQNVNFAIKGSVAALFLDTHGVAYKAAETRPTPSSTALAEEAAAYTVRIVCTL